MPLSVPRSVAVGATRRTYLLVRRGGVPERLPLILVFHGSNGSARQMRGMLKGSLDRLAREGRAVVAYLDGYKGHWNDSRVGSDFHAVKQNVDDLAFAQAVVDQLTDERKADPHRVVALGFSQGGQMVLRLLHERPNLLSGAALAGCAMPAPENWRGTGEPTPNVPLMIIAGTKDPCSPYDGGQASLFGFRPRGEHLSSLQTAEYFARAHGIDGGPRAWQPLHRRASGDHTVTIRQWGEGRNAVRHYAVAGGGHRMPVSGDASTNLLLGGSTADIDTGTELASFLLGA